MFRLGSRRQASTLNPMSTLHTVAPTPNPGTTWTRHGAKLGSGVSFSVVFLRTELNYQLLKNRPPPPPPQKKKKEKS